MVEIVKDPKKEGGEYCLDCFRKHTGHSAVLVHEALDRIRQNPQFDDIETVGFIRYHIDQAIDEYAAAEEHVKKAIDVPPEVKTELDGLAHQARLNRNNLRNFIKTIPPTDNSQEFHLVADKIKSKELLPRVDFVHEVSKDALNLRDKASLLSSKIGCGDCLAKPEDLAKVQAKIDNILKPANIEPKPVQVTSASQIIKGVQLGNDMVEVAQRPPNEIKVGSHFIPPDMPKSLETGIIKYMNVAVTEIMEFPVQLADDMFTAFFGTSLRPKKPNR